MNDSLLAAFVFVLLQLVFYFWRDRNYWRDKHLAHVEADTKAHQMAERWHREQSQKDYQELMFNLRKNRQHEDN